MKKFEYNRFDLDNAIKENNGILEFDTGFKLLFEHIQDEFERYINTIDK